MRKDDGGDIVETSFLMAGLLCARQYFDRGRPDRGRPAPPHRVALERRRVALAHQGRDRGRPLLALEPEQRLEHEPPDPRLERVPDHLRAGRLLAALRDRARGLPPRLGRRPRVPQRQDLLRRRAAARPRPRRPALLRPLLLPVPRPARPARPLRRLLAAERGPRAHQPPLLRRQPEGLAGLRSRLLGPHGLRQPRGLPRPRPRPRGRPGRDLAHRGHRLPALRARAEPARAAPLPRAPARPPLGRVRLPRRVRRDAGLVRRLLPRDRPGADRRHDREPPQRPPVAPVHELPGGARRPRPARLRGRRGRRHERPAATGPGGSAASSTRVYPRSFQDSDGDGIGDLAGIIQHADYLPWLGVDAVWISPFYPSPMADFGYDVVGLHRRRPDVRHARRTSTGWSQALHARGIRVILDFVPNHSSDQHPWFVASRRSRDDPKRDWYVWRDPAPDGGPPNNWVSMAGGGAWAVRRRDRPVLPALVPQGAARPQLAQPGRARGDARRAALLARARRRRLPGRRAVVPRQGPRVPRRAAQPRLPRGRRPAVQAAPDAEQLRPPRHDRPRGRDAARHRLLPRRAPVHRRDRPADAARHGLLRPAARRLPPAVQLRPDLGHLEARRPSPA